MSMIYIVKKYVALFLCMVAPLALYAWGNGRIPPMNLAGYAVVTIVVCLVTGALLLKNPFSMMLEGSGLLVLDINSTGIIRPFIVNLRNPFLRGEVSGTKVSDVYDRDSVYYLTPPLKGASASVRVEDKKRYMNLEIDDTLFVSGKNMLGTHPVLIWNDQLKTLVTKDWFSAEEKKSFARHQVLYLNRRIDSLGDSIRDFARYVVKEATQKDDGMNTANLVKWILIGGVIVVLIMFAPKIIAYFKGSTSQATNIISNTGVGQPIVFPQTGG